MSGTSQDVESQPTLIPVIKPLSLIPVWLKEAALDSPTFRATSLHFCDQIEAVEKWLESYVKVAAKLATEVTTLEGIVNSFLASSTAPHTLSEAILDHDYTLLAMRRYGEGAKEFWTNTIGGIKKTQNSVIDPIKTFLQGDIKLFKEARRHLETSQRALDSILARYAGQTKTKEPSSLREDAFQLHEARKNYLKACMDFCIAAPKLRSHLDSLLIRVFSDQWLDMKNERDKPANIFKAHSVEVERIRNWSKDLLASEKVMERELEKARKSIEESAEIASRPTRDLDDYSASTVPYLGSGPTGPTTRNSKEALLTSKQGWLFLKTVSGKPNRTTWVRRWFFVKNGIFGWLIQGAKSGGVEESEKIGVLLCSIRPAFQEERRFCFEIKTKDTTILLQAETQTELVEWMSVFDVAKQKAIDEPATTDLLMTRPDPSSDPAFAVSPAVALELAAKKSDGQVASINEEASTAQLVPEGDIAGDPANRASFDVSALRKATERAEGERRRDHAARIIQKLDLHRKSDAVSQLSPTLGPPATPLSGGGIASLISASHNILPIGPIASPPSPAPKPKSSITESITSSLAPATLVNPPAPTNLSKLAVLLGAERGLDLGLVDFSGGMPSSLMANQWGSTNYGHISRVERGEVNPAGVRKISEPPLKPSRRLSDPSEDVEPRIPDLDGASLQTRPEASISTTALTSPVRHRKTVSEINVSPQRRKQAPTFSAEFPSFYPLSLKAHDAQFRMLFPNVSHDERVVLVFRASWSPNEQQDLPGRLYVTPTDMYFYSHNFGFTLVSGASLSAVLDVTAKQEPGNDLLLLEMQGRSENEAARTISIKTFIEPVRLLQKRLKFLALNCNSDEPLALEGIINNLMSLESDNLDASSDTDSWQELSPAHSPGDTGRDRSREVGASLRVDKSLYVGDAAVFQDNNEGLRFRLPTRPVVYRPRGMSDLASERTFSVSARALFHICFGDKSLITQMMYRERRARTVKQFPWIKHEDASRSRQFEYRVTTFDSLRRPCEVSIVDTQTIEVANEHLCYVVKDHKVPWHLPYPKNFSLISKVVITHVAKSKAKLAVFTKIEWQSTGMLSKKLIERHALDDLHLDAQCFSDIVADQVQRLGPQCDTKRAIDIFGHLGHQTDVAQITDTQQTALPESSRIAIRQRSLAELVAEAIGSFSSSAASTIISFFIAAGKGLFSLFTTHRLLIVILFVSLMLHSMTTANIAGSWWQDRKAAAFMARVGIKPDMFMQRAVTISDLEAMVGGGPAFDTTDFADSSKTCFKTFTTMTRDPDTDMEYGQVSSRTTATRMRRTRQRMSAYRHDLLVALRFVNNVEREAVKAEYSDWLHAEMSKCRMVGSLLEPSVNGTEMAATRHTDAEKRQARKRLRKVVETSNHGNLDEAENWLRGYCESCAQERGALDLADVSSGILF